MRRWSFATLAASTVRRNSVNWKSLWNSAPSSHGGSTCDRLELEQDPLRVSSRLGRGGLPFSPGERRQLVVDGSVRVAGGAEVEAELCEDRVLVVERLPEVGPLAAGEHHSRSPVR